MRCSTTPRSCSSSRSASGSTGRATGPRSWGERSRRSRAPRRCPLSTRRTRRRATCRTLRGARWLLGRRPRSSRASCGTVSSWRQGIWPPSIVPKRSRSTPSFEHTSNLAPPRLAEHRCRRNRPVVRVVRRRAGSARRKPWERSVAASDDEGRVRGRPSTGARRGGRPAELLEDRVERVLYRWARLLGQRAPVVLGGFFELPLLHQRLCQIVVCRCELRVGIDRLAELRDRVVGPVLPGQHVAEAVVRLGGGPARQGLAIV